jgi:hypothetical protein
MSPYFLGSFGIGNLGELLAMQCTVLLCNSINLWTYEL